jgi:hypothetical protein
LGKVAGKKGRKEKLWKVMNEWDGCGMESDSGWVAVVSIDRADQGGSNGVGLTVAVAVLAEI